MCSGMENSSNLIFQILWLFPKRNMCYSGVFGKAMFAERKVIFQRKEAGLSGKMTEGESVL